MSQQPYEFTFSTNSQDTDKSKITLTYFNDLMLLTALEAIYRHDGELSQQLKALKITLPPIEQFVAFTECLDIPVSVTTSVLKSLLDLWNFMALFNTLLKKLGEAGVTLPEIVKKNIDLIISSLGMAHIEPSKKIPDQLAECLQAMLRDPLLSDGSSFALFRESEKQASSSSSSSSSSMDFAPYIGTAIEAPMSVETSETNGRKRKNTDDHKSLAPKKSPAVGQQPGDEKGHARILLPICDSALNPILKKLQKFNIRNKVRPGE